MSISTDDILDGTTVRNVQHYYPDPITVARVAILWKVPRAVLVRFDHVASTIVNANHGVMGAAAVLRVIDCVADFDVP